MQNQRSVGTYPLSGLACECVSPDGHADIEQDRKLIAEAIMDAQWKQTIVFAAIVLVGMYLIERKFGRE